MAKIELLTQETIDKIAAGEVVERPASVVKELVENALDAGATAITVEIKEGGISFIRITDNGCGIEKSQVKLAFMRHSTSKIRKVEDLLNVSSLGFRGEALSSISAVSRVELITKTYEDLTGSRYVIEGSKEIAFEEIGAPEGTTFLIKDLFYNVPARRKFLKTAQTEGSYISDIVEKLALSHPDVSFKFINGSQTKLHTSGNGNRRDLIYHIYGREIAGSLFEVEYRGENFSVSGFIGKPVITRGNRNYENFFVNGRYIKSPLLSKAVEEGYKNFLMQHQYPFVDLYFSFGANQLDVNVHPTKMELRIENNQDVYREVCNMVYNKLSHRDLIPDVPVKEEDRPRNIVREYKEPIPEPFESRRLNDIRAKVAKDSPYEARYPERRPVPQFVADRAKLTEQNTAGQNASVQNVDMSNGSLQSEIGQRTNVNNGAEKNDDRWVAENVPVSNSIAGVKYSASVSNGAESEKNSYVAEHHATFGTANNVSDSNGTDISNSIDNVNDINIANNSGATNNINSADNINNTENTNNLVNTEPEIIEGEQQTLEQLNPSFMSRDARKKHKIIGQLFKTYWLIEYEDKLFIIDQHAAHEKVLFERTMAKIKDKEFTSQIISPPIVLSLDARETEMLEKYREQIERLGYEVEHFGGKEYMISAIPDNLYKIDMKDLFIEMLDDFSDMTGRETPDLILEKVASMSCKAAVKGNDELSPAEMDELIEELLTLDNPYNCPHGRPTIISMSKYEIEKKFKRIV